MFVLGLVSAVILAVCVSIHFVMKIGEVKSEPAQPANWFDSQQRVTYRRVSSHRVRRLR